MRRRSTAGESLLLQAESGPVLARFIWREGRLLGGHSGTRDLLFSEMLRGIPRARVSLMPLSERAAAVMWSTRQQNGVPLAGNAGGVLEQMAGKTGVLVGSNATGGLSYWEKGRPICGFWNGVADMQNWKFIAVLPPLEREALVDLWVKVIDATHAKRPLGGAWEAVAEQLSIKYPALDSFVRDIDFSDGRLVIKPELDATTIATVMHGVYPLLLAHCKLTPRLLGLQKFSQHSMWEASGLAGFVQGSNT